MFSGLLSATSLNTFMTVSASLAKLSRVRQQLFFFKVSGVSVQVRDVGITLWIIHNIFTALKEKLKAPCEGTKVKTQTPTIGILKYNVFQSLNGIVLQHQTIVNKKFVVRAIQRQKCAVIISKSYSRWHNSEKCEERTCLIQVYRNAYNWWQF